MDASVPRQRALLGHLRLLSLLSGAAQCEAVYREQICGSLPARGCAGSKDMPKPATSLGPECSVPHGGCLLEAIWNN